MTTTRFLGALLLLLAPLAAIGNDDECGIPCLHDTTCVKGKANFTWHPLRDDTGVEFDFHKEIERNGFHCGCPPGLTGLRCGRKYESCSDGDHVCYNGGQCIATMTDIYQNDQQYCDCPASVDSDGNTKRYSGKYCEVEIALSGNRCGDANQNPCQNGGTCKNSVDELDPCDCPEGYVGRMCEFFEPSVPKCSLHCQHGGTCRYGTKEEDHTLSINEPHLGQQTMGQSVFSKVQVVHENYMYCECPGTFKGVHCETEETLCGDIKCRHGSACVSVDNKDTGETTHHCDCNEINQQKKEKGDKVQFAGRHCEIVSTSVCKYDDDADDQTFCTHNGTCPAEWHEHCTCPDEFHGAHCQFKVQDPEATTTALQGGGNPVEHTQAPKHESCRLDCKNGGHCRKGSKQDAHVQQLVSKYGKQLDALGGLNITYNQNFEHCACPDGFVGIECEYSMTECGDNGEDHPCFHGSICTMVDSVPTCVCSESDTKAAGVFCQHLASDVCDANLSDEEGGNRGFCTNGGVCVTNKDGEAACRCHSKFEGAHCEFSKSILGISSSEFDSSSKNSQSSEGLSGASKLGITMTVILCVGVIGFVFHTYQKKKLLMDENVAPVYPDMDTSLALDDQSLRAAPIVDVGPEKDFDGNELRNVELL